MVQSKDNLTETLCDLHIRCIQAMVQIGHSVLYTAIDAVAKENDIPAFEYNPNEKQTSETYRS